MMGVSLRSSEGMGVLMKGSGRAATEEVVGVGGAGI